MQLMMFYTSAQRLYRGVFVSYGKLVGRHPIVFIVAALVSTGLLALGLLRLETETELERLYTPINSQAAQDRQKMKARFPDQTGTNYNIYSLNAEDRYGEIIAISDGNVFSNTSICEIRDLVDKIKQFIVGFEGRTLYYSDLCARASDMCVISGDFLLQDGFLSSLEQGNVTYPLWNNVDISFFVAGVNVSGDVLQSASVMKLTFHLRQDNDTMLASALTWEDTFVSHMKNQSSFLKQPRVHFATSQSLGDELNQNTDADVYWFSLSFSMLITYASLVASGDCVGSRNHLARAGILAAGFGILAGIGLVCLCGVKWVNVVGLMPIVVLAVGVDDMFLMMSAWAKTNVHGAEWDIPKRVGHTFSRAGIGITITSLTDFLAFMIGATSDFLSIRNFCIFMAAAIILCFLFQTTFFAGCMSLQGRRVEASRHCCTCHKISSREELREQGRPFLIICCCGGKPPRERRDSIFEKCPSLCLTNFLLTIPGKVITLVMFVVYVCFSVWGVAGLKQGLFLNLLVPPSSYYHGYSLSNYHYFGIRLPVQFVFSQTDIDYKNETTLKHVRELLHNIGQSSNMNSDTQVCWLLDYVSSKQFNKTSNSAFVKNLKKFLNDRPDLRNGVVFGPNETITASRCHVVSRNVPDSMDQANLMLSMRQISNSSPLQTFAYHPMFIYFEQFVSVLPTVLRTVGVAVAAMVVVTAILLPHPVIVAVVLFNILMILLGIFGFMAIWDLSLSAITMIHLVMSVGFSVDFTVHVCSAYMLSEGETRNDRARDAIIHAAGPIFNGGLSTFIGICTLVASQSYVFQSFFRIMVLNILFGVSHAVLLMPVLLSLVGPIGSTHRDPIGSTHTDPIWSTHRDPIGSTHTDPIELTHRDPIGSTHSNPIESTHSNPIESTHSNPIESVHSNPTESTHSNPIESTHSNPIESTHSNPIESTHSNRIGSTQILQRL
ncbi:patched domain-containing protein 3-like [Haliotis cracherodii]|uniref:patched domain-containing protein 3-like n=1 Tax=Haliotis cracherodii TaxID=6455 RepID=UPI0039EC9B5A